MMVVVSSGEKGRGRGVLGLGEKIYKLLCIKITTRIYSTIQGIKSISYNNSKRKITFKNCE